jgi:O-antigen/teichoic acid export membrane protein
VALSPEARGREARTTSTVLSLRFVVNAGWTLAGQIIPLLVAVITIPVLIRTLGLSRYGLLTIVWVLVGYAGVFDLGLGRAMSRLLAARLAASDPAGARERAQVALIWLLCIGLLLGALLAASAGWFVHHWLAVPPELEREARNAIWLLALSLPAVMLSAGYSGVLVAHQRFGGLNLTRTALGVANYVAPLAIAVYSPRLEWVVGVVVASRLLSNRIQALLCRRHSGVILRLRWPDRHISHELFSLGGWMSVSNVVSPLLSYLDRLIIGGLVPLAMVAYYSTAYDVISRLLIVPYALMGAMFPIAAGVHVRDALARVVIGDSARALFLVMCPALFTCFVLAKPLFGIWLGPSFAVHGALVLQILAVGLLMNSVAQAPATIIQAAGNPKWMAVLHLIELPLFLVTLWWMTHRFGITGTAVAGTLRYAVDALIVALLARRMLGGFGCGILAFLTPTAVAAILFGGVWLLPQSVATAIVYLIGGLALFALYAWHQVLTHAERDRTRSLLRWAS